MLSKRDIKLIKSLRLKKHRLTNKLFVVEGKKSISEFIQSNFSLFKLFSIDQQYFNLESKSTQITESDLKRISFLTNPDDHLAVFRIPEKKIIDDSKLLLGLDGINDPGNLGTIIRTCDWYNITDIICSNDSVDCFNPKVVQSAMGSLSRVNITYLDLKKYLSSNFFAQPLLFDLNVHYCFKKVVSTKTLNAALFQFSLCNPVSVKFLKH